MARTAKAPRLSIIGSTINAAASDIVSKRPAATYGSSTYSRTKGASSRHKSPMSMPLTAIPSAVSSDGGAARTRNEEDKRGDGNTDKGAAEASKKRKRVSIDKNLPKRGKQSSSPEEQEESGESSEGDDSEDGDYVSSQVAPPPKATRKRAPAKKAKSTRSTLSKKTAQSKAAERAAPAKEEDVYDSSDDDGDGDDDGDSTLDSYLDLENLWDDDEAELSGDDTVAEVLDHLAADLVSLERVEELAARICHGIGYTPSAFCVEDINTACAEIHKLGAAYRANLTREFGKTADGKDDHGKDAGQGKDGKGRAGSEEEPEYGVVEKYARESGGRAGQGAGALLAGDGTGPVQDTVSEPSRRMRAARGPPPAERAVADPAVASLGTVSRATPAAASSGMPATTAVTSSTADAAATHAAAPSLTPAGAATAAGPKLAALQDAASALRAQLTEAAAALRASHAAHAPAHAQLRVDSATGRQVFLAEAVDYFRQLSARHIVHGRALGVVQEQVVPAYGELSARVRGATEEALRDAAALQEEVAAAETELLAELGLAGLLERSLVAGEDDEDMVYSENGADETEAEES